jgi:hypothetical protein
MAKTRALSAEQIPVLVARDRYDAKAIVSFARKAKIPCCILPKPGGPRPEAPNLHINNVNGHHGRLKE